MYACIVPRPFRHCHREEECARALPTKGQRHTGREEETKEESLGAGSPGVCEAALKTAVEVLGDKGLPSIFVGTSVEMNSGIGCKRKKNHLTTFYHILSPLSVSTPVYVCGRECRG